MVCEKKSPPQVTVDKNQLIAHKLDSRMRFVMMKRCKNELAATQHQHVLFKFSLFVKSFYHTVIFYMSYFPNRYSSECDVIVKVTPNDYNYLFVIINTVIQIII